MPDAIALFDPAQHVPCKASAPVIGKRFVSISGPRDANGNISVAHSGAGGKVFGVAEFDSRVEEDHYVTVAAAPGLIMPVTAPAAMAAGTSVVSDANGQAVAAAGAAGAVVHAAGFLVDAVGAGGDAFVKLHPHSVTV